MIDAIFQCYGANLPQEIAIIDKDINQVLQTERLLQWNNLKVNFAQETGVTLLMGTMLFSLIYGRLHGTVSPGDFALVLMISLTFVR